MDHGSAITAKSTVTPAANNSGQAVAQGIYLHQGDIQVTLDNGAKIDVTATATTTVYGTASVNYTYGIYAESEAFGDSVVSMNHASTITGTAAATADKYASIWENSGIQVWNDNQGDVSVTLANKSSIANTSTATVNNSGKYSSTARATDSYGIYPHSDSGDSGVSLDSGATITIAATATNNNLGSSVNDRAYATDIYGIHSISYYGDTSVTLNNLSNVSATAKATAQDRATADAVGVYAGAEGYESSGNATVTMRAGSKVTATAETNTTPGSESTP